MHSILLRSNTNVKNISFDQINVKINAPFFLLRASFHQSFTFNSQFIYKLKVRGFKCMCGIFHFRFRSVFI